MIVGRPVCGDLVHCFPDHSFVLVMVCGPLSFRTNDLPNQTYFYYTYYPEDGLWTKLLVSELFWDYQS